MEIEFIPLNNKKKRLLTFPSDITNLSGYTNIVKNFCRRLKIFLLMEILKIRSTECYRNRQLTNNK